VTKIRKNHDKGCEMIDIIKEKLKQKLDDCEVKVTNFPGGGNHNHLGLVVGSNHFEGLPIFKQHQIVMHALTEELKSELHAVQLKTVTLKTFKEMEG
jgi:stress-induced morphogen